MHKDLAVIVCNEDEFNRANELLGVELETTRFHSRQEDYPGPHVVSNQPGFMPVYGDLDSKNINPSGVTYYLEGGYEVFPSVNELEEYIYANKQRDKYIFLERGEMIKEGDEILNLKTGTWHEAACVGMKVASNDIYPAMIYRRKVSG